MMKLALGSGFIKNRILKQESSLWHYKDGEA